MSGNLQSQPIRAVGFCCLLAAAFAACSGSATFSTGPNNLGPDAPVTFVMTSIPDSVIRVDLSVTGNAIDAVFGTVDVSAGRDRLTIRIPIGGKRNVFARAFNEAAELTHIGEADFTVMEDAEQMVTVPLNYKGPHAPF